MIVWEIVFPSCVNIKVPFFITSLPRMHLVFMGKTQLLSRKTFSDYSKCSAPGFLMGTRLCVFVLLVRFNSNQFPAVIFDY